ncbi:serine/threonine-protein kinase [Calycomorphotria hydatis]|uniref:Serine/threonine-protein kinase PknD n=1 Tax=Calycomorphotria hydatis TaxID=2528027 RepID=A0A517T5Y5_9PLAN|nr:serine/threonine-protein kinase [Calycomorphotria hydatis]QDT63796.1 Serine/threonine-protein kinase PknD [Calycomorphotria hydatis]
MSTDPKSKTVAEASASNGSIDDPEKPQHASQSSAETTDASNTVSDSKETEEMGATVLAPQGAGEFDSGIGTKQERDIAFGVVVLDSGQVGERQLARAVTDWTIHGHKPLAAHLVSKGLLDEERRLALEHQAQSRLERLDESIPLNEGNSSTGFNSHTFIDRIDSRGRIARLLGIAKSAAVLAEEDERQLGSRYRLLRKLGQGGLGTVWLAQDENLRRLVAIKEINTIAERDEAAIARFRREAEITGRLEHPGIVPIYQFGTDKESARYFYVMRFLGKQTLQDAINEYHERREAGHHDSMDLHRLLTAFVSVCQSVAHAHSRKIIHRDLKPENVALDNFGQVVLLDWGLAKINDEIGLQELGAATDSGDPHDSGATIAGQVLGTPMYMAPEQAAGRIDEIDERTDVYGLGAILFAILTGAAPHERSRDDLSSSGRMAELFSAIVSNPVPNPRDYDPNLPAELCAICVKATANKRYLRYHSASALADDVERQMAGEPVSAYEEPTSKRVQRWMNEHPRLSQAMGVIGAILLALFVLAGVKTYQDGIEQRRDRYENLRAEARELEINLRSISDNLRDDVRFMADLPPIQQLIDIENERANPNSTDDREVWRTRLGSIYRGLLRAWPAYLSVTFGEFESEMVREIVRTERSIFSNSIPTVLPASRLAEFQAGPAGKLVQTLKPEDVFVIDGSSLNNPDANFSNDNLILIAGTPIYDSVSGEVFGFVAIESNLEQVVRDLVTRVVNRADQILVLDSKGDIRIEYSEGRGIERISPDDSEHVLPAKLRSFVDDPKAEVYTDKDHLYAVKVGFDPRQPDSMITLVLLSNE